jgi:hypothetical protein
MGAEGVDSNRRAVCSLQSGGRYVMARNKTWAKPRCRCGCGVDLRRPAPAYCGIMLYDIVDAPRFWIRTCPAACSPYTACVHPQSCCQDAIF